MVECFSTIETSKPQHNQSRPSEGQVSVDLEEPKIYTIGRNPDRRFVWTTGGTSGGQVPAAWAELGIGISEFLKTRNSRPFKS